MSAMRVLRLPRRRGGRDRPSSFGDDELCVDVRARPGAPCSDTANTSVPWKQSLQDTPACIQSGACPRVITHAKSLIVVAL